MITHLNKLRDSWFWSRLHCHPQINLLILNNVMLTNNMVPGKQQKYYLGNKIKYYVDNQSLWQVFFPVHRSGARRAKKDPVNIWRTSLTRNPCCINILCLSLLCIQYMSSGHSAAQEIKHVYKFNFIGLQIFSLREVSDCPRGPNAVVFRLA